MVFFDEWMEVETGLERITDRISFTAMAQLGTRLSAEEGVKKFLKILHYLEMKPPYKFFNEGQARWIKSGDKLIKFLTFDAGVIRVQTKSYTNHESAPTTIYCVVETPTSFKLEKDLNYDPEKFMRAFT